MKYYSSLSVMLAWSITGYRTNRKYYLNSVAIKRKLNSRDRTHSINFRYARGSRRDRHRNRLLFNSLVSATMWNTLLSTSNGTTWEISILIVFSNLPMANVLFLLYYIIVYCIYIYYIQTRILLSTRIKYLQGWITACTISSITFYLKGCL